MTGAAMTDVEICGFFLISALELAAIALHSYLEWRHRKIR